MATLDRVVVDGGRVGLAATACVRVRDLGGQVVGSGFLVGPDLVATCAHVVADAVGADERGPAPTGPVPLEFPVLPGVPQARRGTVTRWVPVDDRGRGDVALLRLDRPAPDGVAIPPVRSPDRLWDHRFRTFGFPDGRDDGVWSTGRLRGGQGTGWYQLQSGPGEQPIEPGFSGAPVWDERTGATVGMTVAADRDVSTGYLVPIADVLGLDPDLLPNPYRGLEPFGEEHAPLFHGRDPELERLRAAVAGSALVAVTGPSGSGKSSLVGAGLVPGLRADGIPVATLTPDVGAGPAPGRLAAAVLATADPGADPVRRDRDAHRIGVLLTDPATRDVGVSELMAVLHGQPRTVLVVDQFEELLDAAAEQARALLEIALALSALCTVVTLRAATLDRILTPGLAAGLAAGTVLVGPLDRERLRQVITGPAGHTPGLAFENGLVDAILDDVPGGPSQLPLLESLLARLWADRVGGALTLGAYAAAGGVAGALATQAEAVVESIVVGPDAERALAGLLGRLVGIGPDGEPVRRPVRYLDLPEPARALVPALAAHRLVVLAGHGEASTVELAHLALAEHWPRLRDRVGQDRAFLRWRTELDAARQGWEDHDRRDDRLLPASSLDESDPWGGRLDELSGPDRDYLDRSRLRRRRTLRRRRLVAAGLAVAVLVAAGLTVVAVRSGSRIADQETAAAAETLARLSGERAVTDPVLAAELALAAQHNDPANVAARTALATAYRTTLDVAGAPVLDTGSDETPGVFGSGGGAGATAVTVGGRAGRILISLVGDPLGDRPVRRDLTPGVYQAPKSSADGHWVAGIRRGGGLDLFDMRAGPDDAPASVPTGPDAQQARFTADGSVLSWVEGSAGRETLRVFDMATRRVTADVPVPGSASATVVAPGVGLRSTPGRTFTTFSLADGRPIRTVQAGDGVYPGAPPVAVSCTPSGGTGTVVVTDLLTGATRPIPLGPAGTNGDCGHYWVSAEGGYLLTRRLIGGGMEQWRAVRIRDGQAFWFTAPPLPSSAWQDTHSSVGITLVDSAAGPVALTVVGPDVVRLRTVPGPPPTDAYAAARNLLTADGRTVLGRTDREIRTTDRATGRVLATRPLEDGAQSVLLDDLWTVTRDPGARWRLTRYAMPGLTPVFSVPMAPGPGPADGRAVTVALTYGPDRRTVQSVVAVDDGVLSSYDPATGRPTSAPRDLAGSPQDTAWFATHTDLLGRRGVPGQVLLQVPDGHTQLWDVPAGRMLLDLPFAANLTGTLFADGDRLTVFTRQRTLSEYDLTTGQQIGADTPSPIVNDFLGVTPDRQLVARTTTDNDIPELALLDPDRRTVTATLPAGTFGTIRLVGSDLLFEGSLGVHPAMMSTDPARWRDAVCRIVPPGPAPGLQALLPPGALPGTGCD